MSNSQSEPSPPHTAAFNYNVRWMTRTFNTRAKVESLLGPELAAGNITSHDYEVAIAFLPGFHRYYGLLLSSAALSAVYVLRKPSWPQLRMLGVATGTAFGSLALGNALTLKSHFDFVRSLNNTAGFAGAIDRIQKQAGLPQPNGPIIQRRYEIGEGLHGNTEEQQEFTQTLPMAESPPPPPPQQQQEQSQSQGSAQDRHPSSKWDQIRAANAAASTSSTWDALRQKHEKSQAQKPGNDSPSQSTNPPADDRATEQARFNALLERERNLSSQHRREE